MSSAAQNAVTTVEATVSSKGQVTLPSELRKRLGLQKGSRVRFSMPASGPVQVERVLYTTEDLWRMADAYPKATRVMTFDEMNAAKGRRGR